MADAAFAMTPEEQRMQMCIALRHRMNQINCPDKYRVIAEWWRLFAEDSQDPKLALGQAANMDLLADDMERRPDHYLRKPADKTVWQWAKIGNGIRIDTPSAGGGNE